MIRVLVAEDHTIVREGIKQLIGLAKDMQVAGEAGNGERQPARRDERLGALVGQPGFDQPVGDELLQVVGGARLHTRRDFLGEQLKQEVRAHAAYPIWSIHAAQAPLARSRTRPM